MVLCSSSDWTEIRVSHSLFGSVSLLRDDVRSALVLRP